MKRLLGALAGIALLGMSSNAFALPFVSLGVVGGPNYNISTYPTVLGTAASGGMGYSAGLSAEAGPIAAKLLYTSLTTDVGTLTSSTSKSLQIPVHFTMGLLGSYVGFGGFLENSLEDGGGSNYGLSAGVKVAIPVTGLSVEGLVNYGLKDQGGGVKGSTAALLLGFSFL